MHKMMLAGAAAILMVGSAALAAPSPHPQAEAQALDLAQKAIAFKSVEGPGNETAKVAELFKSALVAGGLPERDITITPLKDTAFMVARWRGSDPRAKPIIISGHMDVVAADPADWQRDPFTPVVEKGYLFGRGATDMKLDAAIVVATINELRRTGFKPRRDIVLAFSGDEETTMETSQALAKAFANSEMVLNIDGPGGLLDETTGKPLYWTWQGAEKIYADFQLTVTNPGGHSSEPRPVNAINQLAAALVRIGQYHFEPQLTELNREALLQAAKFEDPDIGAAMRAFVANPRDPQALAVLRADPSTIGRIGTTCVTTMVSGGHALNALPQRATANINCRIFPGHKPAEIMAELKEAAAEPAVEFKDVTEGSVATDPSPFRPDLVAAIKKAMDKVYPGVPVFPSMASGASDSMWFRANGVPSYGVGPVFVKASEEFAHGLNERTPISNIRPAVDYYTILLPQLTR